MRAVLRAVSLGMLAPALLGLAPTPAQAVVQAAAPAAGQSPSTTTSPAVRSCWLPEEDLVGDHCGDFFMYAGADQGRQRRRSLVEFGFGPGSIPAGAKVVSAEAHVFQDGGQSSGTAPAADYALARPGAEWTDWSGETDQLSIGTLTLDASQGWRTWALPPEVVEDWATKGHARVVLSQVGKENRRQTLGFRSAAGPRSKPYLEVTYELPLFVSPSGLDTDPGTRRKPLRSIQRAVDLAGPGDSIQIASGTYDAFNVPSEKTDLTIDGDDEAGVVIANPSLAVGNLVTVWGDGTTLSDLTVQDCRPDPAQDGSLETTGSAGIRVDGAAGVTLANVTVHGGREMIDDTRGRGCYGIMAVGTWDLDLGFTDIYDNGAGIYVRGGGRGLIHDNSVHDHTMALIRNTSDGGDDFGAAGITFDHVLAGEGGFVAEWNNLTDNVAASYDYGYDGGGFEIYASSGIDMRNNTLVANDTALETGADTDSDPDIGCSGNSFTSNTVVGYDADHPKTPYAPQRLARKGLVLRCDEDLAVTANHFTDVEYGAVTLINGGGVFDAGIDGLQITGNTVIQHGLDHFVTVEADLSDIAGLGFADNTYVASHCDWYFAKFWFMSQDMTDWTRALEQAGVSPAETGSTFSCT